MVVYLLYLYYLILSYVCIDIHRWVTTNWNVLCPTSYIEINFDNNQLVMGDKMFSSYGTVFELVSDLQNSEASDLNWWYEAPTQQKIFTICHGKTFEPFLYVFHCPLQLFGNLRSVYYPKNGIHNSVSIVLLLEMVGGWDRWGVVDL